MELFEAIQKRRSIRKYSDEAVPMEKVEQILEAARQAPSWKNVQPWSFVVVSDRQLKEKIGEAVRFNPDHTSYEQAAYIIVACADPNLDEQHQGKDYYLVDAGIAFEHVTLAATALGLATCWIALFDEQPVKELLGVPENLRVVALTPLGVPAQERNPRPRKAMEEIAFANRWGTPIK